MKRIIFIFGALLLISQFSYAQQKKGKGKKPRINNETAPPPAPVEESKPAAPAVSPMQLAMDSIRRQDSVISAAGYDPLSLRKVHVSDVMYRMQVWRVMDLREKCNQPFFAEGNEITKAICEAVFAGKLIPYAKDSLTEMLSIDKFKEKLMDQSSMQTDADGNPIAGTGTPFMPKQLYTLKFRENLLFDKQRSRFYYDIQTITLFVPAEFNTIKGTEQEVASFKYLDVVKVFRNMPCAMV